MAAKIVRRVAPIVQLSSSLHLVAKRGLAKTWTQATWECERGGAHLAAEDVGRVLGAHCPVVVQPVVAQRGCAQVQCVGKGQIATVVIHVLSCHHRCEGQAAMWPTVMQV